MKFNFELNTFEKKLLSDQKPKKKQRLLLECSGQDYKTV